MFNVFSNLNWTMAKYFTLSVLVIVLDQITKAWASETLIRQVIEVFSLLDFRLAHNYGAAFSFLSDAGGWQRWFFIVLSTIVSFVVLVWVLRLKKTERWLATALALVLGGGVGNLIDRINFGYVVDFISVHYQHYAFPTFNIADMAISLGAFMLIIDMLFFQEPERATDEIKD